MKNSFRALSRVIGMGPSYLYTGDSWKTLAPNLIALLACSDDTETMRRVAQDQIKSGGKIEHLIDRVQATPSASFSSAFRKANAVALDAGQTTVMEVTLYDFYSLEPFDY